MTNPLNALNGRTGDPDEMCRFCPQDVMVSCYTDGPEYAIKWCNQCGAIKEMSFDSKGHYVEEWNTPNFEEKIQDAAERLTEWLVKLGLNYPTGDTTLCLSEVIKEELGLKPNSRQTPPEVEENAEPEVAQQNPPDDDIPF